MTSKETVLDTTGLVGLERARALLAISEAQKAGNEVQMATADDGWEDGEYALDWDEANYRVKPVLVRTEKTVWTLAVPLLGASKVGEFSSRAAALDYASWYVGDVLISEVVIVLVGGVEVSRAFVWDMERSL